MKIFKKVLTYFLTYLLLSILNGCSTQSIIQERGGVQTNQQFDGVFQKKVSIKYLLYLPKDYEKIDKHPLLLFLHGAGERGDNLDLVKTHGPAKLVEQGKEFPFIIVSPQCPLNQRWNVDDLIALLDEVIKKYNVDENRIYVTGLSMGGNGTWKLAAEIPNRLAAIVPICGWGDPFAAMLSGKLPVWAFHGAKDQVVPISSSEMMVETMKRLGAEVKFTVYPEANHDAWTETYNNPEVYEWLLQHSLEQRSK